MCNESAARTLDKRRNTRGTAPTLHIGFTIIELMAALTIGALIVLGARMLLEGLSAQSMRLDNVTHVADADANGERLLRALLGQLEIPVGLARAFGGDVDSMHFSSWCRVPGGWEERCRVVLSLDVSNDSAHVIARLSTRETLTLMRRRRSQGFRYLADAAAGGTWFERWGDGRNVPLAVGLLVDDDTIIVRIGERN